MKIKIIFVLAAAFALACGGATSGPANNANANQKKAEASPSTIPASVQTVSIESADGVKLVGSMYAAAKENSPAVLLLHQWQANRHTYDEFAARMNALGFAVLSIDGRGFGESTKKADGSSVAAGQKDADVKAMLGDVDAAYNYLAKQVNVDASRVGIVGASYGSSLAIMYAADHPNVAAVALLSPGLNYFGTLPTAPAVAKYGNRPLFLTAANDDKESADAVKTLANGDSSKNYQSKVYEKGGHGTALFKVGLGDELEKFLSTSLEKGIGDRK